MGESITTWQNVTARYIENFFKQATELGVSDVTANITLTDQTAARRRLSRSLQQAVKLTFTETVTYRTTNAQPSDMVVLEQPFFTSTRRAVYVQELLITGDPAFASVATSTPISRPQPPDPGQADDPDSGPSILIIIIIVVCAAVVAVLVGLIVYFIFRKSPKGYTSNVGDGAPATSVPKEAGEDVSTLQGPAKTPGAGAAESLGGYGDQSVATVDYDYSKAYGGGADTSVSSAGGTFGSNAHTLGAGQTLADLNQGGDGMTPSFSDDGSFGDAYRDPNVREELIDIYAPPGKLGVVIDTPDDGAPVVHAIKDSSVIADKLQVGDKLVAVDDEDVRTMTAIKVSKLISRKSANATRKLSIIRTVVVDVNV